MRLYPDIPVKRANTATRDAAVLLAVIVLAILGLTVYRAVDGLSVLGRGVHDAGTAVERGFTGAADRVGRVPLAGGPIADALRSAGTETGGDVAAAGARGEERAHRLGLLLGLLTFGLPATMLLSSYVPRRLAQVRALTDAERVLNGADPRLVAMRAAFGLPYRQLLAHTPDPLGDLEAERYDRLIAALVEDSGLRAR